MENDFGPIPGEGQFTSDGDGRTGSGTRILTAPPGSPVSPFLPFLPRLPCGPGGPENG